jgi:serine/threonine protein kinase
MPSRPPLTAEFDATVLAEALPRHVLAGHMRYRHFQLLAEGGKAQVFSCRDVILGRDVALKLLHRRLAESPLEQQLLVREARIMAALRHAAIPEIYDLSRDPDGRPCFAMSLKLGLTLHDVLTGLRAGDPALAELYDLERLVSVLLQVAAALEYAHRLNVVHCDLKPENIIVDAVAVASLVDWGLAIVDDYDEDAGANPAVKARGRQGSALYMAPEQAAGDARLTTAVDVYGLGVLLYECLTLRTPHLGATKQDTLRQIVECEPAAPRTAAPGRHIPLELQALCLRALRKRPDERLASMSEFRAALEDCRTDVLLEFERASYDGPAAALGGWDDRCDFDRATDRCADAVLDD